MYLVFVYGMKIIEFYELIISYLFYYLLAGCYNDIKLIDLNKNTIIKTFEGHKKLITCIKKVIHPKYGECLISQGYKNDQLKLWII